MSSDHLNQQFGHDGAIQFSPFHHTVVAELSNEKGSASVSLYGGQVLSYKPKNGKEVLFISPHAIYADGKAIRGGIPVCWPWFNAHPHNKQLPSHGFARISHWSVKSTQADERSTSITLELKHSPASLILWPLKFTLQLKVTLTDELSVELTTINEDTTLMEVTAALHSYFAVNDISDAKLTGLEGNNYRDDVREKFCVGENTSLVFQKRIDRRYEQMDGACFLSDKHRQIRIGKAGSGITVVWNPGKQLGMQMPDLKESYKQFVCVEAANSLGDIVALNPGESHTLATSFGLF